MNDGEWPHPKTIDWLNEWRSNQDNAVNKERPNEFMKDGRLSRKMETRMKAANTVNKCGWIMVMNRDAETVLVPIKMLRYYATDTISTSYKIYI